MSTENSLPTATTNVVPMTTAAATPAPAATTATTAAAPAATNAPKAVAKMSRRRQRGGAASPAPTQPATTR
ncbi:hypothetical protein [Opitutus sp. ER46]|uniref:hypothetical protein n=1 Tax=Opitutus sp. ER46 TaxID=2161864 RepID=UPI0011B202CF|nr:hypothetical protein [Opitutus sp. ER46]